MYGVADMSYEIRGNPRCRAVYLISVLRITPYFSKSAHVKAKPKAYLSFFDHARLDPGDLHRPKHTRSKLALAAKRSFFATILLRRQKMRGQSCGVLGSASELGKAERLHERCLPVGPALRRGRDG